MDVHLPSWGGGGSIQQIWQSLEAMREQALLEDVRPTSPDGKWVASGEALAEVRALQALGRHWGFGILEQLLEQPSHGTPPSAGLSAMGFGLFGDVAPAARVMGRPRHTERDAAPAAHLAKGDAAPAARFAGGDAAPAARTMADPSEKDAAHAARLNASCFFVRPCEGGTLVLPWAPGLTASDAKQMLTQRLGARVWQQVLTYQGRVLVDCTSLEQQGVTADASLHKISRLLQG